MSNRSIRLDHTQTAAWLLERDHFLILTHKRPDGDTIGSACGLARALRKIGKTAFAAPNPEITPRYAPMAEGYLPPDGFEPEVVISVDTASVNMFQHGADEYYGRTALSIDHHGSHEDYSDYLCLEADSASCGEIIYEIICDLGCGIDKDLADLLYVAVSTDTGCFSQANTTARSLETGAKLVYAGADHVRLNRMLFEVKSSRRMAVEAAIINSIHITSGGKVAVAVLSQNDIDRIGATEDDLDNISSLVNQVEGVVCGALVREKPGCSKVSVRSNSGFDASLLCARFGGGGHVGAAGCELKASLEETVKRIEEAAAEVLSL